MFRSSSTPTATARSRRKDWRSGCPRSWRAARMRDPRQRLVDMDHEGIDVAIIFGTSIALTYNGLLDKALAGAICHAVNCWLLEYVAADPKRLKAVGRSSSGSHQT